MTLRLRTTREGEAERWQRAKQGGLTMTDHEHADAIRKCIGELHKAVRAARKSGLTVDLQLWALVEVGADREFDPHTAVTVSREA
jgi:hypothetical protein